MSCGQIITMFENAAKQFRLRFTKPDGSRANLDTEVTAIEFEIKRSVGVADPPFVSKSLGAGIVKETQSGDTLGEAIVTIAAADTTSANANWVAPYTGVFYYDVIVVSGGARIVAVPPSELRVKALVNNNLAP